MCKGRPDFDGEERIWRDELKSHTGDVSKDRYFAAAETKLADALYGRAIYCQTPIPDEVEKRFKDALSIFQKYRGNVDGSYAQLRLANVYYSLGRYEESEKLCKVHLNAVRKRDSEDSWSVRQDSYELASLYESQKRYAEAEALLKNAVCVCKEKHPKDFSTPYTVNLLAMLYYQQGRDTEAIPLFEEAIRLNDGDFNDVGLNLGCALHRIGRDKEAEARLKEVLATRRQCRMFNDGRWQACPEDAEYHGPVMIALGQVYASEGRYSEAESVLRQAVQLNERALHSEGCVCGLRQRQQDLKVAGEALARIYLEHGRAADARSIQRQIIELTKPDQFGTVEVKPLPETFRA